MLNLFLDIHLVFYNTWLIFLALNLPEGKKGKETQRNILYPVIFLVHGSEMKYPALAFSSVFIHPTFFETFQ